MFHEGECSDASLDKISDLQLRPHLSWISAVNTLDVLTLRDMSSGRPGEGRYSHMEREQRWQLRTLPANATSGRLIIDHYILGTTLRLRLVEEPRGAVYKLSQKVRVDADEPERVKITNTYLSANEFDLLCILPSRVITKNRWTVTSGGLDYAVDEFMRRHEGLVLAERELGDDERRLVVPEFAEMEVTHDNEYSGGWLANATDSDIHRLISRFSSTRRGI